jgi:GNAT superfamily N-acetyltransferase
VVGEVTTWYLEMHARPAPRARTPPPGARVDKVEPPSPQLNAWLYRTVGAAWQWTDRLSWTNDEWRAWVDRPEVETLVLYEDTEIAGYVELEAQPEGNVEVAYFGLLQEFIGRGLGGYLLGVGVQHAWDMGAHRVWVHTCSLDGPHALSNYVARGFRVYDIR